MRFLGFLPFLLFAASIGQAQTVINLVTDAASYAPRVAAGSLATVFGSNLANGTQQAPGFPLPTSMAGTTVYVNNAAVPLLYVSQSQINFQVPGNLATGTASMRVSRSGGQSPAFQFTVASSAPGIFQDTSNHAIAQNASDNSTNSSSSPVASGDVLVVYLTGQGAVDNAVADGAATPNSPLSRATATPIATIGGVDATVQFLGLTPGFTGLAQANIVVPSLGTADYPLVISVGGYVSASAMVSVSGSGTAPPKYVSQTGHLDVANGPSSSIVIYGNTTYICGPNRINIIDTSDVTSPTYVGEFGDLDLAGNGGKCAINMNTSQPILVDIVGPATNPSFAVYSLAAPQSPVKLSQLSLAQLSQSTTTPLVFLADLSFAGTVGYASTSWYTTSGNSISAQHGDFFAFDFTNLAPALIGVLTPTGTTASSNVSVKPNALVLNIGNYHNTAYITTTTSSGSSTKGQAALTVVDVSNVQSMVAVGQLTVPSAAIFLGFGYDHDLVLATGNTTSFRNPGVPDFNITGNLTLSTLDITNVQSPRGLANVTTNIATMGTYVVQPLYPTAEDVFAIVNDPPSSDPGGPQSLMIVDATTPSSPKLYPVITQFGMADVAAVNGYLLVPNVNGLDIYTIQKP